MSVAAVARSPRACSGTCTRRADDRAAAVSRPRGRVQREPEVEEQARPPAVEPHVLRLDVAVDDAVGVRVGERAAISAPRRTTSATGSRPSARGGRARPSDPPSTARITSR